VRAEDEISKQMEVLLSIAALIAVLLGFALAMLLAVWAVQWILRPMSKEAQRLNLPRRYSLSDFVWLLVMLQIALAVVVAVVPEDSEFTGTRVVLLTFACGTAVALWAFGIDSLSRSGVTQSLRRGVFTVFLLPATLVFLMATTAGPFALAAACGVWFTEGNPVAIYVGVGGIVLWPLICWSLRKVAEWILSQPPADHGNTGTVTHDGSSGV
jgi:hypothetical protein